MILTRRQKIALLWWLRQRSRKRIRSYSVHSNNLRRTFDGEYHHLMPQLREDDRRFENYFRMKQKTFDKLLDECFDDLTQKATNFCDKLISPEERLVVTLRFLATGESFRALGYRFRMGFTTIRKIVIETVHIIWTRLQPSEMPVLVEDSWNDIAKEFFSQWNFPLCIGAIDCKHIQIKAPPKTDSKYYNSSGFHSVVLIAIADARGRFIFIDVRGFGSDTNDGIIQDSTFYKLLKSDKLKIPQPTTIPGTSIKAPYVFVADKAFPLTSSIMRPFPKRDLTDGKWVFNYRLSRARQQVECAFGIASSKWHVLMNYMQVQDTFACDIVKAVCVLHNFVLNKEEEHIHLLMEDTIQNMPVTFQNELFTSISRRPTNEAIAVREVFMSYFMSPGGTLEWQFDR